MKVKTVDVRHAGGDRFVASTGSGHEIGFDSAAGDTALRPTEAVIAALAACAGIDVHSIALKQRQELVAYVIHVRAEQRDGHPDYFTRIDVVHEMTGPGLETAAIRRCIELSATRYCPVNAMLSAGPTEIHHRYRILRPDESPEEGEVLVSGPFQRPVVA
ncbi:MAG: OsmC family protein [Chloroflexi bacterium]|nr:OsmC family protein [Chloroflexota bacterium]